jgi:hypothetical protein
MPLRVLLILIIMIIVNSKKFFFSIFVYILIIYLLLNSIYLNIYSLNFSSTWTNGSIYIYSNHLGWFLLTSINKLRWFIYIANIHLKIEYKIKNIEDLMR